MNRIPTVRYGSLAGSFAVLSLLILFFQNCTPQVASNSLVQPKKPSVNTGNVGSIPFAFDYSPDIISYMSCAQNETGGAGHLDNRFYSFKVGSYLDGSGLRLRQEFIDYMTNNFTYKDVLDPQSIRDALTSGTENKGTFIQLSVRESTPLATGVFYLGNVQSPPLYQAFNVMPSPWLNLSTDEFLPQLLDLFDDPTLSLTSLGTSQIQTYPLETTISYFMSQSGLYKELGAKDLREYLMDTSTNINKFLTVSFSIDTKVNSNIADWYVARSAPSSQSTNNLIRGNGFKLTFAADGSSRGAVKRASLSAIEELNLSETQAPAVPLNWDCNNTDYSLMIVSPRDAIKTDPASLCKAPDLTSGSYAPYLDLHNSIRKVLPESKWAILNVQDKCVVPIDLSVYNAPATPIYSLLPDCYGERDTYQVAYQLSTSCQEGVPMGGYVCPNFVSFCFKPTN